MQGFILIHEQYVPAVKMDCVAFPASALARSRTAAVLSLTRNHICLVPQHVLLLRDSRLSTGTAEAPDGALMAAVRAGNQDAMAQLYDRYSPVVYAVALRVLGDTSAAEDVLQEIFMQLWRNPAAFDASRGNLAPWLAVIARNRALDVLRKRKPQTEIDETTVSVEPDLAADADRTRVAEKVRSTLKQMPAAQRSALEMA